MVHFDEDKSNQKVQDLLKREEEELVQMLSIKYGVEYADLSTISINTDALRLIDEQLARDAKVASFAILDKKVRIAMRNPFDSKTNSVIEEIKNKGYTIIPVIVSTQSLEKAWKAYKDLSFAIETKAGSLEIENKEITNIVQNTQSLSDIVEMLSDILTQGKSYRISKLLETILAGALATKASDIHIEPEEAYIRVRYRLDGVLVDVIRFDIDTYTLLLSRIKLLSGLKLNIKKNSQDGRFSVKLGDTDIEIRTSILPGAYNESIVLRILNPKSISVPLEDLGIPSKLLSVIMDQIHKPEGMILTTGPTGSGKTTTLYAFLRKVHKPDVKIITIEDPIEYHLPGIVQTQTNEQGYSFAEGLRSALRQDPEIIMVGEIRDSETATTAVNASLTGHLVFSTLHTNSAAGTFPRLFELGVNPKIISSSISIALAQRLVRVLCKTCKKKSPLEGVDRDYIIKTLDNIVDRGVIPQTPAYIYEANGCAECNFTGYKERLGLYEGILVNQDVNLVIENMGNENEIRRAARPQGILTLLEDGIIKVVEGKTSLDELRRVVELK